MILYTHGACIRYQSHNISLLKTAWVQYLSKILCWVFRASEDSQKCKKFKVFRCFALDYWKLKNSSRWENDRKIAYTDRKIKKLIFYR
jgi:hypothetical protein